MMNDKGDTNIIAAILLIPITLSALLIFIYAFAPAIDAVLGLWELMPADNSFYTESIHNNVIFSFTSWHLYVIIVGAMSFVYLAVNIYKKQRMQQRGDYEQYYEQ